MRNGKHNKKKKKQKKEGRENPKKKREQNKYNKSVNFFFFKQTKKKKIEASEWDPNISVTEILEEVSQIFNDIPVSRKDEMNTVRQQISQYTCMWCGHTKDSPIPAKGICYGHVKDEHIEIKTREPLVVQQDSQEWRDAVVPEIGQEKKNNNNKF
ncbi:hypothetical protein RFI_27776 [Reticulomyxa filosa]|uniref:Uncharacterized protein n=1 Tax=Reticulomyxa filosa TaxID=46433 RepID=X6M7G1_RETFI|nr:hypothetical protein RFI_27776 [Reticulomyxa filosa]|eukprot:ETO09601.1 hypothetical protein RFI_27776 [Reticulomyxa filosa]